MLSPEQQAADYRAQGYDFLALTDHNIMKTHVQFNSDDFLMVPGWERDIPYGTTKCLHVVGLFPSDTPDGSVITRPRGNPDVMSQQQLIDQMRSENVFVEIAHPIWSRMEPEELRALQGFNAIEIFNTGTERLCHAGHAEVYWDMLLREGRHITGIACDDTHGKTAKSDRFFGWVMVRAEALTREAILRALCAGDFYASQGPAFTSNVPPVRKSTLSPIPRAARPSMHSINRSPSWITPLKAPKPMCVWNVSTAKVVPHGPIRFGCNVIISKSRRARTRRLSLFMLLWNYFCISSTHCW